AAPAVGTSRSRPCSPIRSSPRTLRNMAMPGERSMALILRPLSLAPVAELQHFIVPFVPVAARRDRLGPDEGGVRLRVARRVADRLDPPAREQHEPLASLDARRCVVEHVSAAKLQPAVDADEREPG